MSVSHADQIVATGSISAGSLFFTFPTRGLTDHRGFSRGSSAQ
jgi:hypothetical protein